MTTRRAEDIPAVPLDDLRRRIDALDDQIAGLLQERAKVSREIGRTKAAEGAIGDALAGNILVPEREAEVLERVRSAPGPLPPEALSAIYREVLSTSRALQRTIRVAHLGPAATFGYQAAREFFGSASETLACSTNQEVFTAVEKGSADYGLVPIENSTEGPVLEVLDRFVDTPLQACAEVVIPVSLALVSHARRLSDVRRIVAHPQALGQARGWLEEHLPGVLQEPVASNGKGAELAAADATQTVAGIAPRVAAEVYGLGVLASDIQDSAANYTRFLVLGRAPSSRATGRDRTAVVFSIRDRVGALRDLTDAFASGSVNLSSIHSRPSKRRAWDYLFFVELDGHLSDDRVKLALRKAEEHTVFLKVLGSWPAATD